MTDRPRYKHPEGGKFLGHYRLRDVDYDLYWLEGVLIARWGNGEREFTKGICVAEKQRCDVLKEAEYRAREQGLMGDDE